MDFAGPHAEQVGLGDPRQIGDLVFDFFRKILDGGFGGIAIG
jgi:hypothetical protein